MVIRPPDEPSDEPYITLLSVICPEWSLPSIGDGVVAVTVGDGVVVVTGVGVGGSVGDGVVAMTGAGVGDGVGPAVVGVEA